MPAMASAISGNVFTFPVNSSRLVSLSLKFAGNGAATVDVKYYGEPLEAFQSVWMGFTESVSMGLLGTACRSYGEADFGQRVFARFEFALRILITTLWRLSSLRLRRLRLRRMKLQG